MCVARIYVDINGQTPLKQICFIKNEMSFYDYLFDMFQLMELAFACIYHYECEASPLLSPGTTAFKNTTFGEPSSKPLAPNAIFKDDLLSSGLQGFNVEYRKRYHVDFQFYDNENVYIENGKIVIKSERRKDDKIVSAR